MAAWLVAGVSPSWEDAMHPCPSSFVRLAVAGSIACLVACASPASPAVHGVTIDQSDVTVSKGASTTLTVTVQAVGGASKAVTWTSGAPLVAEVDAGGVVTGLKPGAAQVTAASVFDPSMSDSVTVTVTAASGTPMTLTVDTTLSPGTTVTLPLSAGANVTVDWGDGSSEAFTQNGNRDHTYAADGVYEIAVRGSLGRLGNEWDTYPNADKLTAVTAWGDLGLTSLAGAFRNAIHLTTVPDDLPPSVTSLYYTFYGATAFDHDIGAWDVTNVTTLRNTFFRTAFNQDLGAWNTANVTDLSGTFRESAFDQDIGGWTTSSVTNMGYTFSESTFDQDIGAWDTANVTLMQGMFWMNGAFDQDIGGWNTAKVADMSHVFHQAAAFNQDIGAWDTGAVTNMRQTFNGATAFAGDIGAWNTAKVTDMAYMFHGATAFDGAIGSWDTSSVTDMTWMFRNASTFDQDLSGWCVSTIPQAPEHFDSGAASWVLPRPVWGTCPPP